MSRGSDSKPGGREIAALAYQKYEKRGRHDGHDLDDWLEAEREISEGWIFAATFGLYDKRTS